MLPRTAHVMLTGAHGNVGDAIIRRRTLDWVRGAREVHAYVGATTPGWVGQLRFGDHDRVHHREHLVRWLRGVLFGARGRVVVLAPGEVALGRRELAKELGFLALTVVVRLTGGVVVRPPRALRGRAPATVAVHRLACRLSAVVMWRDAPSAALVGTGLSLPDIGFGEAVVEGAPWSHRSTVMVTLRGNRPFPSPAWVQGITAFADAAGLRLQTFAQVRQDEARAVELATALGAEHLAWGERDTVAQEERLRRAYGDARVVVSDRLHVLVFAMLSGALPAEVVDAPSAKIREHFAQIGVRDLTLDSTSAGAGQVQAFLDELVGRHDRTFAGLAAGRAELAQAERLVQRLVAGAP